MKLHDDDIITVGTVEEYASLFGCPPVRHPLFSVCRLSEVRDYVPIGKPVRLDLYSMVVKDGTTCNARYGWRDYDFSSGSNGMLDFLLGERDKGRIRHLGWSFHGDIDVFDKVLGMHPAVHWDFVQIQLNYVDWRHAAAYNSDWQAARCIGCGQCAPKCPQGIDIPSQMRLIDGYVEQLRRAAPGL